MLLLKVFSEKSYLLNEGLNQKGSQFKNGPKFEILENENCFVKQFLSLSFQDTGAFLGLILRVFYCSKVLSFIVFATWSNLDNSQVNGFISSFNSPTSQP